MIMQVIRRCDFLFVAVILLLLSLSTGCGFLLNPSPPLESGLPPISLARTVTPVPARDRVEVGILRDPPTFTPTPTRTPTHTPTPTSTKVAMPPTRRPTRQTSPTPTVERVCQTYRFPDAYQRNLVGRQALPPPVEQEVPHFWLDRPIDSAENALNTSYPYGYDAGGSEGLLLHNGIDLVAELGTEVLAVADGVVEVAQKDDEQQFGWRCDWYGQLVVVRHNRTLKGTPVYSLYGHVLNLKVNVGDEVERGQPIAEVGVGGAAFAPHLHLEIRLGENDFFRTSNPFLWFKPKKGSGVVIGRLTDKKGFPWHGVKVQLYPFAEGEALTTWSYLDDPLHISQFDPNYAENFLFGDVAVGRYTLYVDLKTRIYRQEITVKEGETTLVEIKSVESR